MYDCLSHGHPGLFLRHYQHGHLAMDGCLSHVWFPAFFLHRYQHGHLAIDGCLSNVD